MILCLSCVVVFCTVYALILPAITLERKTVCGQEEHSHTEECYSSDGQLTCGKTEHTHTESCYADDKTSEDQSGEDSQQTPEQNQTEGQEQNQGQSQEQNQNQSQDQSQSQNQVQTSDDGNVAQNGENGDTAGTTADETAGNDEESIVAGSTPAPAAEGEDGTGSATTTTEGFDLSADASKVESVSMSYQEKDGTWKKIEESGNEEIPGDANIKLEVEYKDIQIQKLIQNHNCTLTYDLPDLLRNEKTDGKIMDGNKQVGTLTVQGKKIVVQFDQSYLASLEKTTIKGNFFITGEVNLSKLQEDGTTTVTTAGKTFHLNFGEDPVAQYGKVDVKKECANKVISKEDGDYIQYTITVTAGEDGCPDVSVVDTVVNGADYVSNYAGIVKTKSKLENKNEVSEPNPYEEIDADKTVEHGEVYVGKPTTDTENPIPTENTTSDDELGSMVWKIGGMKAGEVRKLTYYVKLKDGLNMKDIASIDNKANVYSKKYHKGYGGASFKPQIDYDMNKKTSDQGVVRNEDGTYTIEYQLIFTLKKDSSNYPLKNFVFWDYLNHSDNATDTKILSYISYKSDSFKLERKDDGSGSYQNVENYKIKWSTDKSTEYVETYFADANCFSLSGTETNPFTVNPGDSYRLTYSVTVQPEALAVMQANSVQVKNRWIVAASNAYNARFAPGFEAVRLNKTIDGYTWNEKVVGKETETNRTINLTGSDSRYDLTKGKVEKDSSTESVFSVPVGSYPYTVKVNETKNDWDATEVSMTDTLTPADKVQYVGYAKVEACKYNENSTNSDKYEVKETKWVKIDGLKTFTLKPSDLGWNDESYAYRFTYYVTPVNKESFGQATANNRFELKGEVGRGGNKFNISEIYSQTSVNISGNYSMNIRKEAWHYEKAKADATKWKNGKLYWVIEVDGTAILKDTAFKDEIVSNTTTSSLINSYLHSDSLVGIYIGKLEDGKTITDYKTLEELQASEKLKTVTDKFTSPQFGNSAGFTGEDVFSEFTITAKEKITLGENKLYFVVQTEPQTLPTKYRDSFTYRNQVSTSDDGTNWIPQSTADKTLCGGADILKELGQTFTYDGEKVTSEKDGKDDGHSEKIIQNALTGSGQYASWVFKLNYAGELSGTYRVLETIPDGMELAYIRIKWVGPDQKKQGFVESKKIADFDEGWKEKQTTAGTDDAVDGNKTTTYYVKGNQALIALGDFYPGKATDSYSVDVQVVCKVVDPKVLLGGEKKKFTNYVTLQTQDGQDIRSAFSSATIETKNLEKTVKNTEPNKDEKVHFTIKANELGQTLPTKDGTTLKLIDKLSSTLILDTSTIRVVNSKNTSENVTFTASLGADNTLEIQIPCDQPVTITYTATVNAPPGQAVSFSNNAYWENYAPASGSGVEVDGYSYSAGGTISGGENIKLKIIKKDQNDLSRNLSGAQFKMVKCKRTDISGSAEGKITELAGPPTWTGTTDENGEISFGKGDVTDTAMKYNTIYKVIETKAPDGYVEDNTPYYIMVPKEASDGKYPSDVEACINDPQIKTQYQEVYKLTVMNHKGEITVEKQFKNPGGYESSPVSGTYWFGLYDNADGTNMNGTTQPLQEISITYYPEDKTIKTNKFVNLDTKKTYYVFELDDKNQPIKDSSTVATVNEMEYFTSYTTIKADGSKTTESNSATNGDTVTVTNQSRVNKLPSTGSCGVLIYRLAGAILILFAVVLMLMKYKETKTRN